MYERILKCKREQDQANKIVLTYECFLPIIKTMLNVKSYSFKLDYFVRHIHGITWCKWLSNNNKIGLSPCPKEASNQTTESFIFCCNFWCGPRTILCGWHAVVCWVRKVWSSLQSLCKTCCLLVGLGCTVLGSGRPSSWWLHRDPLLGRSCFH